MNPLVLALSAKTKAVLEVLLLATQPVSTAEIARQLGLSPAQVRYCLRTIAPWLRERGLALVKTPRVGLFVPCDPARRRHLLEEVQRLPAADLALTGGERLTLLLLRLLLADGPVPEAELQRELAISRSSFFRDLNAARRCLAKAQLRLQTRRRKGLRVEGDEGHWRDTLVELLQSNLTEGRLVQLCMPLGPEGARASSGSRFEAAAAGFLRALDMAQVESQLTVVERELGAAFPDPARVRLALHLALSRRRVQRGHPVSAGECAQRTCAAGPGPDVRKGARAALLVAAGSVLPATELEFLAFCLAEAMAGGMMARDRSALPGRIGSAAAASAEARELGRILAQEAGKYLNAGLFHDRELVECLALELSAAEAGAALAAGPPSPRQPGDAASANPLFGFAQRVLGPVLAAHGHVSSPELTAALAMHLETALERYGRGSARRRVWVVCGAGVATARNLITRLNLYLPQLEILGLASAFELAHEPGLVAGADAVISTIALDWLDAVPVLRVSPLLTTEDVAQLRATLALEASSLRGETVAGPGAQVGVADLLSVRTIERLVAADHWEAVVDRAGALLLAVGAVWPSYIEAMKDMIRLYGPYVVVTPGAALLHAGPDMGGKRLCFSLVVLQQPVPFGHETNDPVGLALAFSAIDHTTHLRAVGQAITLLGDPEALRAIHAAPSAEHILDIVRTRASVA
jgi:mannitol/fructose-specific phosphotransferase system IIA component (Ntr-type)/biotin operon repressor